jgi:hypothetical protein
MSVAYFIVVDTPCPGLDLFVNGKFIARDHERLIPLAQSLGLKTLDEYVSYSAEEAAELIEEMGDSVGGQLTTEQWFTADEGIAWTTKVLDRVLSEPTLVGNPEGVISDLREYGNVFKELKARALKWHFQVDF